MFWEFHYPESFVQNSFKNTILTVIDFAIDVYGDGDDVVCDANDDHSK